MFRSLREYFRRKKQKKIEKNTQLGELTGIHYDNMNQYANETDMVPDFSRYIKENTTADYSKMDSLSSNAYKNRVVHNRKAVKEADSGAFVLRFNIAGSGINHWPKMEKGLTGYNEIENFVVDETANEDVNENDSFYDAARKKSHLKYKMSGKVDEVQNPLKPIVEKEYGKPMYLIGEQTLVENLTDDNRENARILPGVRIKRRVNGEVVVNTSGPLGMGGTINSGDYSISKLTDYGKQIAEEWLNNVIREIDSNPEKKNQPIKIYLKGHSRGGCAADELSTIINHMVHTEERYKSLRENFSINLQLYDPVPGPDGMVTGHSYIDHSKVDAGNTGKSERGLSVDKKNDATVFYSLHSNQSLLFAPQTVLGAKRVVLTGMSHNMRLFDIQENNLVNSETGEVTTKKSKRGYIDGKTGEEFRGSSLHDAKDGLFVCDENGVLFEIKNQQEAHKLLDKVYNDITATTISQRMRHSTMYKVVDDWFNLHREREEITKKDTRYEPIQQYKEARKRLEKQLVDISKAVINVDIFEREISDSIGEMLYERLLYNKVKDDKDRMTDKMFRKTKELAQNKDGIENFKNSEFCKNFIGKLKFEDIVNLANDRSGDFIDKLANKYSKLDIDPQTKKKIPPKPLDLSKVAGKKETLDYVMHSVQMKQDDLYISRKGREKISPLKADGIYRLLDKNTLETITFAYLLEKKGYSFKELADHNGHEKERTEACDEIIEKLDLMSQEDAAKWIAETVASAETHCIDYVEDTLNKSKEIGNVENAIITEPVFALTNHIKNMSQILFTGDIYKAADSQMGSKERIDLVLKGMNVAEKLENIDSRVKNKLNEMVAANEMVAEKEPGQAQAEKEEIFLS